MPHTCLRTWARRRWPGPGSPSAGWLRTRANPPRSGKASNALWQLEARSSGGGVAQTCAFLAFVCGFLTATGISRCDVNNMLDVAM